MNILDEIEPARLLKEQAKMTRPAVQEKKINQFKRKPLRYRRPYS